MALYIGSSEKLKITFIDGRKHRLNIYSSTPTANVVRLLSSDNYILKDINGLFITAKEDK